MTFEDKTLTCEDCGEEFVFSVEEQEFYDSKGFENEPKRCKACRQKRKESRRGSRMGGSRQFYDAVCDSCGEQTTVPFKPSGDKPVYCRECYQKLRNEK
ncbi:hypothetical protein IPdc08_01829 [archaeon]|nr:hypothetical protein IPdc08_01829 [archaeon]